MSWNGFQKPARKSLINRLQKGCKMNPIPRDIDVQNIWFNIPYAGAKGEFLVKSLVRKLRRYLKKDVRIITRYRNKKLSMFCSTKDKTNVLSKALALLPNFKGHIPFILGKSIMRKKEEIYSIHKFITRCRIVSKILHRL